MQCVKKVCNIDFLGLVQNDGRFSGRGISQNSEGLLLVHLNNRDRERRVLQISESDRSWSVGNEAETIGGSGHDIGSQTVGVATGQEL